MQGLLDLIVKHDWYCVLCISGDLTFSITLHSQNPVDAHPPNKQTDISIMQFTVVTALHMVKQENI